MRDAFFTWLGEDTIRFHIMSVVPCAANKDSHTPRFGPLGQPVTSRLRKAMTATMRKRMLNPYSKPSPPQSTPFASGV